MSGARTIAVTVGEVTDETPLIKSFVLHATDGRDLPAFSGGAHVVVEMRDGDHLRRNPYSLTSSPSRTASYTIAVRREESGRGGSLFMHDRVKRGTRLNISYPANQFPIDHRAKRHVLIAGGIGITPFTAMAAQLVETHQPFELHYAARSREHAAFGEAIAARFGSPARMYYSADGDRMPLERILDHQPFGTHLYVCGPERMITAVIATARDLGWPDQNIHRERFLAPPTGRPYTVQLARSGLAVEVGAEQSMLEAIEEAGVDAPHLCRGGACGQCETNVEYCEGTLLHADHFLSEADKASSKKIMPCVSRFEGRALVLDL